MSNKVRLAKESNLVGRPELYKHAAKGEKLRLDEAVNAKCYHCLANKKDSGPDCEKYSCPLHPFSPYAVPNPSPDGEREAERLDFSVVMVVFEHHLRSRDPRWNALFDGCGRNLSNPDGISLDQILAELERLGCLPKGSRGRKEVEKRLQYMEELGLISKTEKVARR